MIFLPAGLAAVGRYQESVVGSVSWLSRKNRHLGRSVNGKPPVLHTATASSNLARPTVLVAEMVKALGCVPSLCGFESRRAPHASICKRLNAAWP